MSTISRTGEAHRGRILLVDDDARQIRTLGKLLKNCGYDVAEECDSTKAHHFARRYQPDLMILDVVMPWKTGIELADIFSMDEELRDVPLIFMTGHIMLEQQLAGASRVLVKPFSVENLLKYIEEGMGQRASAQAAN